MSLTNNLTRLFYPRSIAVIGATNDMARVVWRICVILQRSNLKLYPVHLNEKEVLGMNSYFRIEDLPLDIDLAVIAVSSQRGVDAALSCAKKSIAYLILVAGGSGEIGPSGQLLEQKLKDVDLSDTFSEMDINPLVVTGKHWLALDAILTFLV